MDIKQSLTTVIHEHVSEHLTLKEVAKLIEKPKSENHGDYSFPCFILAKKKNASIPTGNCFRHNKEDRGSTN